MAFESGILLINWKNIAIVPLYEEDTGRLLNKYGWKIYVRVTVNRVHRVTEGPIDEKLQKKKQRVTKNYGITKSIMIIV